MVTLWCFSRLDIDLKRDKMVTTDAWVYIPKKTYHFRDCNRSVSLPNWTVVYSNVFLHVQWVDHEGTLIKSRRLIKCIFSLSLLIKLCFIVEHSLNKAIQSMFLGFLHYSCNLMKQLFLTSLIPIWYKIPQFAVIQSWSSSRVSYMILHKGLRNIHWL